MKPSILYSLWAFLFILCAGLGFIPEPAAPWSALFTALSVLFFLPPAWLLYTAGKQKKTDTLKLVRNLALASLGLTLLLLVANFSLAIRSETLGNFLHYALTIVSAPMISSGHWALSLFLWSCLLTASLKQLKK